MEKISIEQPKNTLENEEKEKKESSDLKITIFDDSTTGKALNMALGAILGNRVSLISNPKNIHKRLASNHSDVLFFCKSNEQVIKEITKIRNNPEIVNQPAIITTSEFFESQEDRQKVINAGADINLEQPINLVHLLRNIQSVPEFIGNIEDGYSEKILKGKQYFYKEYKDKLAARSEITADTPQELEILEKIFIKNHVKKVLDAGGGSGRIAVPLSQKGYDITNIDASEELIKKMKEKTNDVEGVKTDLRTMPFQANQFDAATYSWHVFCDILGVKSKEQVLSEAYRVLRDDGVIVLDLPDREKGEHKKDGIYINHPGGEAIFVGYIPDEKEMKDYLEEAGFKNVEIKKWKTKSGFYKLTFIAKK